MELTEFVGLLRRRWLLVLLPPAVLALTAVAVSLTTGPAYRSDVVLYVSPSADAEFSPEVAQQRLNAYAALADSPEVVSGIIDVLELDRSVDEVRAAVAAQADPAALLLTLEASGPTAAEAQDVAAQAAQQVILLSQALEPVAADEAAAPWLVVAQEAHASAALRTGAALRNGGLGALLGLFAGCLLALLVEARANASGRSRSAGRPAGPAADRSVAAEAT